MPYRPLLTGAIHSEARPQLGYMGYNQADGDRRGRTMTTEQ